MNVSISRIPGSFVSMATLGPFALLGPWVRGPRVVALRGSLTADARILLTERLKLVSIATPVQNQPTGVRTDQTRPLITQSHGDGTDLQPDPCWPSDTPAPRGESATSAWLLLWMVIPDTCGQAEGMRIC